MTQKELQDVYDKMCEDLEKANNDPDSPYAKLLKETIIKEVRQAITTR